LAGCDNEQFLLKDNTPNKMNVSKYFNIYIINSDLDQLANADTLFIDGNLGSVPENFFK